MSSLTWFLGRYSHNGFSQSVHWDYLVIKSGSNVLKKWKQTSAQQGAHLNCAWPCPAGCYTHLLTHAYAISTFPFGLTDSFQLCWWFNRSTGERRASWGEPGTGCWVQHKVRVNSRVSVGEHSQTWVRYWKVILTACFCLYEVAGGLSPERLTGSFSWNNATGGNMIGLSLLQQSFASFNELCRFGFLPGRGQPVAISGAAVPGCPHFEVDEKLARGPVNLKYIYYV